MIINPTASRAPAPSPIIKPPSPAPQPPQRTMSPPLPMSSTASPFVPATLAPSPNKPAPNPFYTGSTPFFFPQPSAQPPIKAPSFSSSNAAPTAPTPAAGGSNLQLITAPQRIAMLESEVEKYKQELETRESQLEVLAAENRALLDENARLRMEHKVHTLPDPFRKSPIIDLPELIAQFAILTRSP